MDKIGSISTKILLIVCFGVLSKHFCDASLLTVPRSSVAIIGDRVELKCSVDGNQSVIWGFTSFNTSKDTDIYFGDDISSPFKSRYKIDKNFSGQHNLIIDSVDLDHAGRYQCVTIITGNKSVAHLTVLDSSPNCSASTNNEDKGTMDDGYLRMKCTVVYAGNMIPNFTWTKENIGDDVAANISTFSSRTALLNTTSSVIMLLHPEDNSITFSCKITFQLPHKSQGNAPDYEYTWNYTTRLRDVYGPRNLTIIRYEGRLVCSADGNPAPTIGWRHPVTNRSVEGPVLTIDGTFNLDEESIFECTAVNTLGTQRKSIPLIIMNYVPPFDYETLIVTVWFVGCVVVCCTMIVVFIVVKCRQKEKSETRENLRGKQIAQKRSDADHQPKQETIGVHQRSLQGQSIDQSSRNGLSYVELIDKPSTGQQTGSYRRMNPHIDESADSECYVNQRDIELEQQLPEYSNINPIDMRPINLNNEDDIYSYVSGNLHSFY